MAGAGKRYLQLEGKRDPFLRRAREAAKLTIPALLPPDHHTGVPTPNPIPRLRCPRRQQPRLEAVAGSLAAQQCLFPTDHR